MGPILDPFGTHFGPFLGPLFGPEVSGGPQEGSKKALYIGPFVIEGLRTHPRGLKKGPQKGVQKGSKMAIFGNPGALYRKVAKMAIFGHF